MEQNDSHYNQFTNTSGSDNKDLDDLSINASWMTNSNESAEADALNFLFAQNTQPSQQTNGTVTSDEQPYGIFGTNQQPNGAVTTDEQPYEIYVPNQQPNGAVTSDEQPYGVYGPGQQPNETVTPAEQPYGVYGPGQQPNVTVRPAEQPYGVYGPGQQPNVTVRPVQIPNVIVTPITTPNVTFPITWTPAQSYGQVRFLNASTNTFNVDILVDGNPYVLNSRFGMISDFEWIADGFHTITVRRSTNIRTNLFQQNLPFTANQKVTMVLVDSEMGGLEMVRVVDTGCSNLPQNIGCYRFANMSFPNSNYDLLLRNGDAIFRNVTYQEVTSYKQAVAGTYQFSVANANFQIMMRELPIIVIGAGGTGIGTTRNIVLNFEATIASGRSFTTYIIGNNWSDFWLRAITVED